MAFSYVTYVTLSECQPDVYVRERLYGLNFCLNRYKSSNFRQHVDIDWNDQLNKKLFVLDVRMYADIQPNIRSIISSISGLGFVFRSRMSDKLISSYQSSIDTPMTCSYKIPLRDISSFIESCSKIDSCISNYMYTYIIRT